MKKTIIIAWALLAAGLCAAQEKPETKQVKISFDTVGADTARAIAIVDRYLRMIDYSQYRTDSMMCAVSYIIDQSHPKDTMTLYRWFWGTMQMRSEIWQGGKMSDGYYTNGTSLFRNFSGKQRMWADLTQESFLSWTMPLDIRGALYNWRSKGAELYYAGEYNFKGQPLDRIFVTAPDTYDRYYYFEKNSGLLCFVTEEEHVYGDPEIRKDSKTVDWRAWQEFVPFRGYYLPSVESYQIEDQIVVITTSYRYEAPNSKLFTEDYRRR